MHILIGRNDFEGYYRAAGNSSCTTCAALLAGVVIHLCYLPIDWIILPDNYIEQWAIRILVFIHSIIVVLWCAYQPWHTLHGQSSTACVQAHGALTTWLSLIAVGIYSIVATLRQAIGECYQLLYTILKNICRPKATVFHDIRTGH